MISKLKEKSDVTIDSDVNVNISFEKTLGT